MLSRRGELPRPCRWRIYSRGSIAGPGSGELLRPLPRQRFSGIVFFLEEGANGRLLDLCILLADRAVVLGTFASLAFTGEGDGWVGWRGGFGARWVVGELGR